MNRPGQGRLPKPTAIKQAEGNPGRRPLNGRDLLPPTEPEKPGWLSEDAGGIWDELVVVLMDMRVLQASDATMLAELVDAIALLREAREVFHSLPKGQRLLVKEGAHGRTHASPLLRIINQQKEIIHRLAMEFGMSPVSRARLALGEPALPSFDLGELLRQDPPHWPEEKPN